MSGALGEELELPDGDVDGLEDGLVERELDGDVEIEVPPDAV